MVRVSAVAARSAGALVTRICAHPRAASRNASAKPAAARCLRRAAFAATAPRQGAEEKSPLGSVERALEDLWLSLHDSRDG